MNGIPIPHVSAASSDSESLTIAGQPTDARRWQSVVPVPRMRSSHFSHNQQLLNSRIFSRSCFPVTAGCWRWKRSLSLTSEPCCPVALPTGRCCSRFLCVPPEGVSALTGAYVCLLVHDPTAPTALLPPCLCAARTGLHLRLLAGQSLMDSCPRPHVALVPPRAMGSHIALVAANTVPLSSLGLDALNTRMDVSHMRGTYITLMH